MAANVVPTQRSIILHLRNLERQFPVFDSNDHWQDFETANVIFAFREDTGRHRLPIEWHSRSASALLYNSSLSIGLRDDELRSKQNKDAVRFVKVEVGKPAVQSAIGSRQRRDSVLSRRRSKSKNSKILNGHRAIYQTVGQSVLLWEFLQYVHTYIYAF